MRLDAFYDYTAPVFSMGVSRLGQLVGPESHSPMPPLFRPRAHRERGPRGLDPLDLLCVFCTEQNMVLRAGSACQLALVNTVLASPASFFKIMFFPYLFFCGG